MNNKQKQVLKKQLSDEEQELKWLKETYEQAAKDTAMKIAELSSRTDVENLQSIIYQKQYQEMILKQINGVLEDLQTGVYEGITDYLEKCYETGYIGSQFDIVGQGVPIVSPIDIKDVKKALEIDSALSEGLYKRLGEDTAYLKKAIRSEISRGIVEGSSWNDIAEQLALHMERTPVKKAMTNAMRIVRTEGHRVQMQSQMDACQKAKSKGADVVKQWDSILDGVTRPSHRHMDGEIRELDEKFSNGLMMPGEPHGPAAEVVNCRCALLQRARWMLDKGFDKRNSFTDEVMHFDSPKEYDKFKEAFFSDENVRMMKYVGKLEERYGTQDFRRLLDKMTDREYNHYKKLFVENPVFGGKNSEIEKSLAVRKGKIHGIVATNTSSVSETILKKIDEEIHSLFKQFPTLVDYIDEITFVSNIGDDIARASIDIKTLKTTLKLNRTIFSDEELLDMLLRKTPISLSEKDGLKGYIEHEFVHFREYQIAIENNTKNGIIDIESVVSDIKLCKNAREILHEALDICGYSYSDDVVSMISEYSSMNDSEAIAEAFSYCKSDSKLCETIKKLVKKKWGVE